MSNLRFKIGDVVADDLGLVGTIVALHSDTQFPYSVREPNGVTAKHAQTPRMRFADTEPPEAVVHPAHYGGADNPYEVIKVAEAWGLDKDAYLFNVLKYIGRADKKGATLQDHKKARFYLDRKIQRLEGN